MHNLCSYLCIYAGSVSNVNVNYLSFLPCAFVQSVYLQRSKNRTIKLGQLVKARNTYHGTKVIHFTTWGCTTECKLSSLHATHTHITCIQINKIRPKKKVQFNKNKGLTNWCAYNSKAKDKHTISHSPTKIS